MLVRHLLENLRLEGGVKAYYSRIWYQLYPKSQTGMYANLSNCQWPRGASGPVWTPNCYKTGLDRAYNPWMPTQTAPQSNDLRGIYAAAVTPLDSAGELSLG